MKKKKSGIVFTGLSLALCASLALGIPLFGPAAAGANEILPEQPALRGEEGELNRAYLSELSAWVDSRFFPRQTLITLRGRLYALLGSSAVEDVVLGQEGWLYYSPTLADYAGTEAMSNAQISAAARNLALMEEYCRERGIRFLFTVAPNKNTLYPEHMPDRIPRGEAEHDALRLYRALEELEVPYADLFSAFEAEEETLYFAHDSHWNTRGAALAADEICAALGRETAYFSPENFRAGSAAHSGDLYEMLFPAGGDGETDPIYGGSLGYVRAGNDTRPDSITINTASPGGAGTLLAFRDSFGNLLFPYLADAFASAQFSRSPSYDLNRAAVLGADTVLVELVERNLDWLLEYVPVMPAPRRDSTAASRRAAAAEKDETALGPAGCVLWRGTLPEGETPAEGIFLDCGGAIYEAFSLAEGRFAAWLPAEAEPAAVLY